MTSLHVIRELVLPQSKILATPMPLVILQLVIFMTKQKSLKNFFKWIIIYHSKIAGGNEPYFSLLDQITYKI